MARDLSTTAAPSLPDRSTPPEYESVPAGPGLAAPADRVPSTAAKRRRKQPGRIGRPPAVALDALVHATLENMQADEPKPVHEVAASCGFSTDGRAVREVIKAARATLASRAQAYVDLHLEAAANAARKGKSAPIEWALERITEGGERIVDPPKGAAISQGAVSIGIMVGGIPQRRADIAVTSAPLTADDLPDLAIDAADMP